MRFRVTADDGYTVPPAGFALIPGGAYQRGDNLDGMSDAPVQTITVSAFYLQTTETTQAQWDTVRAWGLSHGYTDLVTGTQAAYPSKGANHPVHSVSWFDVVKWCNARSEMEGLRPCYYTGPQKTTAQIYRTGSENVTNDAVCWGATGYRLPTEAEWEKAARGGLTGKRFPRGDTISHSQANYYVYSTDGSTDRSHPNFFYYDVSPTQGYHPTWSHNHDGNYPYTSPVGSFAANDYGLSDMAGNVWEWCWDWYGRYATDADPRGPSVGPFYRVIRGGGWGSDAGYARCAQRGISIPGYSGGHYYFFGFRPARGRL
jgi:formylglycine-generating enzyme required for sulfatase activity